MATTGPSRRGEYARPSSLVSPESSPLNKSNVSSSTPRYHPTNTQPLPKSCLAIPSVFRKYGGKQPKMMKKRQYRQQQPGVPPVVSKDEFDDEEDEPDWTGPSPQKSLERLLAPPRAPNHENGPPSRRRKGLYDGEMEPAGVRGQEAKPVPTSQSFPLPTSSSSLQILRPISDSIEDSKNTPDLIMDDRSDNARSQNHSQFDAATVPTSHERKPGRSPSVAFADEEDLFSSSSASKSYTRNQSSSQRKSSIPSLSKTPSSSGSRTPKLKPPPSSEHRRFLDNSSLRQSSRESGIPTIRSTSPRKMNFRSGGSRTPSNSTDEPLRTNTHGQSSLPRTTDTPSIHKTPSSGGRTATTSSTRSSSQILSDVESLQTLAMRQVDAGDFDSAVKAFSQVLQSQHAIHGVAHPAIASAYHNLGTVHAKRAVETCLQDSLQQQACRNTALECFQAAARAARDSLGRNHPNVAVSLIRVGFILLQSRQYENAVTTFTEALRIRQASFGKHHGLTANVYNNMGVCFMHMDRFEEAWDALEEALTIQRHLAETKSTWLELSDTLFNRGGLCLEWMRRQGPDAVRAGQAVAALEEACEIREEHLCDAVHPSVLQARALLEEAKALPLMASPALSPIARNKSIFRSPEAAASAAPPVTHVSIVEETVSPDARERTDFAIKSAALETTSISFENDESPEKKEEDESCLISETGVESGQGTRIHFPLAWSKAGIHGGGTKRDVQLAGWGAGGPKLESSPGSVFSTGNKARDDLMNRARSILDAHSYDNEIRKVGSNVSSAFVDRAMDTSIEDEVAPLGGAWEQPEQNADQPRPSIQEMLQNPTVHLRDIHNEAAQLLKVGEVVEAQRLFGVVVQCQRSRHGQLHPDVAAALHNLGITLLRAKMHEEALNSFEEAARIRKGSMGQDHPMVAVSLVKVGITLLLLKRFDEALWIFREALSVRKHALGSLHPSTARIYNNIGCVYVEFSEFKQARRSFEAALDIQRSALSAEEENGQLMFATATTLCNLGYLYRFRDMHTKACFVLKEALGMQEKVLGKSNPSVLSTMDNLADSCANSGNTNEALNYYELVLGRIRSQGATDKKSRRAGAVLLYKISRVYRKKSRWPEQLERLKEARDIAKLDAELTGRSDPLERKILYDIRACRENLERNRDRI